MGADTMIAPASQLSAPIVPSTARLRCHNVGCGVVIAGMYWPDQYYCTTINHIAALYSTYLGIQSIMLHGT